MGYDYAVRLWVGKTRFWQKPRVHKAVTLGDSVWFTKCTVRHPSTTMELYPETVFPGHISQVTCPKCKG